MKRSYKIVLMLFATLAVAVLVVVANVGRLRSQVKGVEVQIRYGRQPHLVDEQLVKDSVLASLPHLLSMQVKDVDRGAVASAASKVACLSDVYTAVSVSGKVVVKATQRRPVARLFYGGKEYYFDSEGVIMPSSRLAEPDVIVTGGDFTEPLRVDSLNAQVKSLVLVASWLDASKTYKGLVDQLYIERDGDIIMVPKLGSQLVELGDADNLDEKFAGLMAFYREGMPRAGWNTYSRISLKFRGQVVCTKEKNKQ